MYLKFLFIMLQAKILQNTNIVQCSASAVGPQKGTGPQP